MACRRKEITACCVVKTMRALKVVRGDGGVSNPGSGSHRLCELGQVTACELHVLICTDTLPISKSCYKDLKRTDTQKNPSPWHTFNNVSYLINVSFLPFHLPPS